MLETSSSADKFAVDMVCAGYRMPLIGADRVEAVRRLRAGGTPIDIIAYRLRVRRGTVERVIREHKIRQPSQRDFWREWLETHAEPLRSWQNKPHDGKHN